MRPEAIGTGSDRPLALAIVALESGLSSDRAMLRRAERLAKTPDWSTAVVVRDLPARFRRAYDAAFVDRLARAGAVLVNDWERGEAAPECPAQFLLARWLLDRAAAIARRQGGCAPSRERRWASQLGLSTTGATGETADGAGDGWLASWGIESVRVDPSTWFSSAFSAGAIARRSAAPRRVAAERRTERGRRSTEGGPRRAEVAPVG